VALEEADAVKTRFLASMSYEFRTPLTSIGGFAELLQSGMAGKMTEQGQEYVSAILESVARLGEQIETVLDLSQSEAGLLPLDTEEIEPFAFITVVVREREKAISEGGLHLDLRGNRELGTIKGDRRRLARAIGHIVDNAIAATPEGGRILVDLGRAKGGMRIVVSDNGRGMAQADAARALDGFKISADGKAVERRQGLGLPLARQLIEAHGGKLKLVSEKGVGTTVSILLP
jgi:signal transduction histidine kinase